jgi:hypothetical protein
VAALLEFTATKEYKSEGENRSSVLLKWSNTFQEGREYFDVERSSNEHDWTIIGRIEVATDSDILPHYQHTDSSPLTGKNIYRLRIVGSGQQPEYSFQRMVEFSPLDHIGIYPNPVKDILYLQGLDQQNVYQLQIYNQSGSVIQKFSGSPIDGLNVSSLQVGSYLLIIDSNVGDRKIRRFVKQ